MERTASVRASNTVSALKESILENLTFVQGRHANLASRRDWFMATAYSVRDRILAGGHSRLRDIIKKDERMVGYLSAEFLIGPMLRQHMINLGIESQVRDALKELGQSLDSLADVEEEPGLGNGGLGRLAACYLDSMATLHLPAVGYGIRYEFGIFDQAIRDGSQVEITDKWLRYGNPWEMVRPELSFSVGFGGRTEMSRDGNGRLRVRWIPFHTVKGVACDTLITGLNSDVISYLRLWKAEAEQSFDFDAFNTGDYYRAVDQKVVSENLSKVLYPNDELLQGKRLRLEQQYFLVSCALHDMRRLCRLMGHPVTQFHEKFAVQLNDTHPAIGVAELMRLLIDVDGMEWEPAWEITRQTFHYTNHTLLPEALEKWSVGLLGSVLPRHLEIIYEINRRFLDDVRSRFPGDDGLVRDLSLIDETGERYVRMANLAAVGSRRINGVAALHTELLKQTVLSSFYKASPEKFVNVTNGVSLRRWVRSGNPALASLISERIGNKWISRADTELSRLEPFAGDAPFRDIWHSVKQSNKERLAHLIQKRTGILVDPHSLFDVQVKRIHEYKRQHLNVLHILSLYARLKAGSKTADQVPPRTFIFGGKAAPGYFMAKRIIKLITSVGEFIDKDPAIRERLRVVFVPDFNVKIAEYIYPAADLSEQISTAGKEASGTGNMKFALNGALTIGTLDGANVEIREKVGAENFFLFGHTVEGLRALQRDGYRPSDYFHRDPLLREVFGILSSGALSHGDSGLFMPIVNSLLGPDPFFLLADFASYVEAQANVDAAFRDKDGWTRMSILNTARSGYFSSDRSIAEYAEKIWSPGNR